jgi:hypothetical protein
MKVFSFILKQVYYKFVYTQLLLQANPTGLLELQLPGDLFNYWCHLLQELHVLLISIVSGWSAHDYVYRSLGEV